MIGGRVLDVSAITGFATGRSVDAEARVMSAIEANIVLLVPSARWSGPGINSAWTSCWACA